MLAPTHLSLHCRYVRVSPSPHNTYSLSLFLPILPPPPPPLSTEEAERSLHDALCVLTETIKETRVVCGGGCMEMLMAAAIDK